MDIYSHTIHSSNANDRLLLASLISPKIPHKEQTPNPVKFHQQIKSYFFEFFLFSSFYAWSLKFIKPQSTRHTVLEGETRSPAGAKRFILTPLSEST